MLLLPYYKKNKNNCTYLLKNERSSMKPWKIAFVVSIISGYSSSYLFKEWGILYGFVMCMHALRLLHFFEAFFDSPEIFFLISCIGLCCVVVGVNWILSLYNNKFWKQKGFLNFQILENTLDFFINYDKYLLETFFFGYFLKFSQFKLIAVWLGG